MQQRYLERRQRYLERRQRRAEDDAYLIHLGWTGGRGEWRHPHIQGAYPKWEALLIAKQRVSSFAKKLETAKESQ